MLVNVSAKLAAGVAEGLGIPVPAAMPRALAKPPKAEVTTSPTLSLLARPGDGGIATRKIALLVADGVDGASITALQAALQKAGAMPRLVGPRIGRFKTADGGILEAEASLENEPGVLFDALVLPDGAAAVATLARDAHTAEFIKDQYRHGKTILALGASGQLLDNAGVPATLPGGKPDPGVLLAGAANIGPVAKAFIAAVAMHRHYARETDPPRV